MAFTNITDISLKILLLTLVDGHSKRRICLLTDIVTWQIGSNGSYLCNNVI